MTDYVLIYLDPKLGEIRYDIKQDCVYRIGTKLDNDIVVSRKDVSRHHVMLRVHENWFHVTDLKSKNGTFVNGSRITEGEVKCGDELCLSSARFVILEVSSSNDPVSGDDLRNESSKSVRVSQASEDTQKYRGEASLSDMISLFEAAASAVRRGTLEEPLLWAIEKLGLDGAMILYRDEGEKIAMVASCGELGPLVTDHLALGALAETVRPVTDDAPHLRQDEVLGQTVLVAAIGVAHVLVLRHSGSAPAVGDLRAVLAATEIALRSSAPGILAERPAWRGADSGSWVPADGQEGPPQAPIFEELIHLRLEDSRAEFERWIVSCVLSDCRGNMSMAAERLGMSRQGLFKKAKKLGLHR
ncbi:MAG: FHA domain-containing protein [bacterium]|nr:FHA domain-containing protein [bacterium]